MDRHDELKMIPQKAIDLILEAEGIDQPSKWPGGQSGITIGYGYDLGFENRFVPDWERVLTPTQIAQLSRALGKTGHAARDIAHVFSDIHISREAALAVFLTRTLPKYEAQTLQAFPGVDKLPDLARGALVSLVFNRGASVDGPRRSEMFNIRELIAQFAAGKLSQRACLDSIARQFRAMKRLWQGQGLDGLLKRRDAEAAMVENAAA